MNGSQASNIEEELHKSVEELGSIKKEVTQCLEQAKSTNKKILNEQDIQNWMEEVSNIGCVASKKKSNYVHLFICCSKQTRNLKEDVSETKAVIADLLTRGKKFISECVTINPPGIDIIPLGSYVELQSRESSLNTIITGLNDKDVRIIGLWGMGGIGKTQLVKKIGKIAQHDKLFDLVVFATVSPTPDIRHIQRDIADGLNLQLKKSFAENSTDALDLQLESLSEEDRATKLREGIANVKKILIILDDIWEKIELENIGIPSQSDHQGCKIILTTRRLEVCHHMGSKLEVCLDHLNYDEAWELFCKYAGLNRFRSPNNVTKSIVDQCGGLPLAIAVVGSSLRGRESVEEYEDVLKKLERSDFIDVESADKEIYPLLKVSYDYLEDEETKKIFILCSFYPEDSRIDLETLTRCAFGLRLFENVDSVSDAREKIIVSIKRLLNASLLSDIQYRYSIGDHVNIFNVSFKSLLPDIEDRLSCFQHTPYVTMHDVIRDVALWITKANGAPFVMPTSQELQRKHLSGNATACYLQLNSSSEYFPLQFHYPNLKILMMDGFIKYRDNFMEFTIDLQVFMVGNTLMLPISLGNLNSLKTLHIPCSRNLCIIGKLKNLEILQIQSRRRDEVKDNDEYGVLPEEFGELCNLRLLDLSLWKELKRISCNVLSRLTRVEELYVSFNVIVDPRELKFLPRLTAFSGRFSGVKSLPHDFKFGKLQIFYIRCCDESDDATFYQDPERERSLELDYLDGDSVKIFEQLLPTLEYLRIFSMKGLRNMVPRLDDTGFQNLRQLRLSRCTNLEYLIDNTGTTPGLPSPTSQVFPNLAEIQLTDMRQLRKMCNGPPPPNCLGKIEVAHLAKCPMLTNVVPDLLPVGSQLELKIEYCDGLKNVYDVPIQVFQHAKHDLPLLCPATMELKCLKMLKSIWKLPNQLGKQELIEEEIELEMCTKILEAMVSSFHSLRRIKIRECSELEEIFKLIEFNHRKYDGLLSELVEIKLIYLPKLKYIWKGPQQAYALNNLTNIYLYRCDGLTCLFTSTSVRSLDKLQSLKLVECGALETIIKLDDPFEQMSFIEIKEIHIESCDKLESILPISLVVGDRLPKLESMIIQKCAELKQVFGDGDVNVAEVKVIKMDKLLCLSLLDLPRLVRLLPENYNLNIPSLSQLEVSTWFVTKLVTKHAGGLVPTEDKILQEEMPAKAQIILHPISLRSKRISVRDKGVFLDLTEVVEESNDMDMETRKSSKHIFIEQESVTSALRLPLDHPGFASFNKLQTVRIADSNKLRSLFTLSMLRTLPQLRVLKIVRCNKLDHIVDTNDEDYSSVSESACFPRLERISIEDCNKLRSIWPLSLVEALSCLQKLQVKLANKLEYIIGDDVRNGNDCREFEVIKLPNLQTLELSDVPSLWSVTPDNYYVDCPCLRILCFDKQWYSRKQEEQKWHKSMRLLPIKALQSLVDIKSLELKYFEAVQEVFDLEAAQQPVLEKLQVLKLEQCPYLQYIWKGPTRFISLSNLRKIEASYCGAIKSLFTFSIAQTLCFLKAVTVHNCEKLEHIIETCGLGEFRVESCFPLLEETCFPLLEKLTVNNCKNLRTIFPLSLVSALPELKLLYIDSCPMLETIFQDDIGEQMNSTSLEQIHLPKLETLCLWDTIDQELGKPLQGQICKKSNGLLPLRVLNKDADVEIENLDAEEVFNLEDCENGQIEKSSLAHLKKLRLSCLPNLKCIWKGSTNSMYLWSLRHITINNCIALETSLFTRKMARTLVCLEVIEVCDCNELEYIFEPGYAEDHVQVSCLSKLMSITIGGCDKLKTIFPLSVAQRFPSLKEISVKRASKLEQLFIEDREGLAADNKEITLPMLKLVHLEDLPCLIRICPTSCALSCQNFLLLNRMAIEHCHVDVMHNVEKNIFVQNCQLLLPGCALSQLINFSRLRLIAVNDFLILSKNLFAHNMVQRLQSLEILELFNCKELVNIFEPTNDHEAAASQGVVQAKYCSPALPNLRALLVQGCDQLQTIFPLSVARSLPRLETVYVKGAHQLTQVFSEDKEEHEVHRIITLPKLRLVHLEELPSLSRIWPANYQLNSSSFALELKMCAITEPEKLLYLPSLDIESCALEVLFDFEQIPAHNQIKYLCLAHLPNLTCIWKGPAELINLSQLQHIVIEDVESLEMKNLFTHTTAAHFLCSLETIKIVDWRKFDNLIEPGKNEQSAALHHNTSSPKCLPKLTSLHLEGCYRLQSIFPVSVARCLPSLKKLFVIGSPKLKQIFVEDQQVCQGNDSIKLPVLENMLLANLPCLTQVFPTGYVMTCPPSAWLHLKECAMREPNYLRHLPDVRVTNCSVEVLFDLKNIGESPRPINLPLLCLNLKQLPNLTCIWKGPTELICLSRLRSLIVDNCMALRNGLFSSTLAQTLCLLETILVVNCKELLNLIEPSAIHPGNINSAVNWFPRLVCLQVEGCDRLRSIFPVSVTVKLPRLERMIIKRAHLLEEIFAADQRAVGYKTLIGLPDLRTMHLEKLPRLYSVCPAGYSLSCPPSSVNLQIRNCPSLDFIKYFPEHSIRTLIYDEESQAKQHDPSTSFSK